MAVVGPVPRGELQPVSEEDVEAVDTIDSVLSGTGAAAATAIAAEASRYAACREELEALREEYERYKLRAASVLKSRQHGPAGAAGSDTSAALQVQLSALKERCREQAEEMAATEAGAARREEAWRLRLEAAELEANEQAVRQEEAAARRVAEVEAELSRLRNRTVALLAEKEAELVSLRSGVDAPSGRASADVQSELSKKLRGPENLAQLHLREELSRHVAELRESREARRQLETALRRVEADLQVLRENEAQLRSDLARTARPAGHSLEYAKNVVYRYLVTAQPDSRFVACEVSRFVGHESGRDDYCHFECMSDVSLFRLHAKMSLRCVAGNQSSMQLPQCSASAKKSAVTR